jgi:DNA-binding response OmpR family regulator
MSHRILVIAAEAQAFARVRRFFETQGHDVDFTTEPPLAEALLSCKHYSLLIADPELAREPGAEALDIVSFAQRQSAATRVVLIARSEARAGEWLDLPRMADALIEEPVSIFALERIEKRFLEAS